jgi:hypothetical protein
LKAVFVGLPEHVEVVYWLRVYLQAVAVEIGSEEAIVYRSPAAGKLLEGRQVGELRVAPAESVITAR